MSIPGTDMSFTALFITAMLIVPGVTREVTDNHYRGCPCSINVQLKTADCSSRKLTTVPEPECIPSTIQYLNLANNDLRYQSKQFQGFRSLNHLDLSGNLGLAIWNDSFTGLLELRSLFLNKTAFNIRASGAFETLNLLETLYLSNLYADQYISDNLFRGLQSLTFLDLSYDFPMFINGFQFSWLTSLLHLDLSHSIIKSIDPNIFSGLSTVRFLSLNDTEWYNDETSPELFQPLVSLEELHIEGFCFKSVHNCSKIAVLLSKVPSLKRLYIHNIVLSGGIKMGFSSLQHLEEIHFLESVHGNFYMSFCDLGVVNNVTFHYLTSTLISKIVVHHCRVDSITVTAFGHFKSLKSLDLILTSELCYEIFEQIAWSLRDTRIKNIRISAQCRFVLKPEPALKGLQHTELQYLDLSTGVIQIIDQFFIQYLPKTLRYLYLHNNKISYIDAKQIHGLQNLLILDFSNQNEETRKFSKNQLIERNNNNVCMPLPNSLLSLNVSSSGLFCMMTEGFCGTNFSLKSLNAAHLRNFDCPQALWKSLKTLNSLEELNLSGNLIRGIPLNAFSEQRNLIRLLLAGNDILELSFDAEPMTSLVYLDLRNNTILYATPKFTKSIQEVATNVAVYLDGNRLVCDCKQTEFVAWLHVTNVIHKKNHLTCKFSNGTELSLSRISEIYDRLENGCIVMAVTLGCVAMFTLLHLILIIVALCWHNRWKMNYLLSVGRRTINPYHPLEGDVIEMEYDVYISYERDYSVTPDETLHEFVAQKLYPGLRQKGFRVLIREELDIGMRLYEVISKAVRKCDKVLVLLSKEYCSDYWNVFEFNMAAMEGIYTKRQVVIPIAFENVDRADLHDEVHAFLKVQPVPAYTRNSRITEQDFIEHVSKLIRDNRPFD